MAFLIANLAQLGTANGQTVWLYKTTDTAATVDTTAYFSGLAVNMLKVGDIIVRSTVDVVALPTSVTTMGLHFVASNDGTTVDTADALPLTVTDTD